MLTPTASLPEYILMSCRSSHDWLSSDQQYIHCVNFSSKMSLTGLLILCEFLRSSYFCSHSWCVMGLGL